MIYSVLFPITDHAKENTTSILETGRTIKVVQEENCIDEYANSKYPDQSAHACNLITAFAVRQWAVHWYC